MNPVRKEPPSVGEEPLSSPAAWAEYLALTSGAGETASLPHRLLVQIAHQAAIGDPDCCAIVATLLDTGRSLQQVLAHEMGSRGLSHARMATLLTLYALSPVPSTPADLAYHAEVSRGSMTRILDVLEKRGWIARGPSHGDRRFTPINLTEAGRAATVDAVHHFNRLATRLAALLTPRERQQTVIACERLRRRAAEVINRDEATTLHE